MRLILDTNIVVSGLIWGGVPRQLLELGQEGVVTLYTSSVLLDELAGVLEKERSLPRYWPHRKSHPLF